MANLIELKEIIDSRGILTVVENVLPFDIKRIFYIYEVKAKRGGHGHKKTQMAFICIKGSCEVFTDNGREQNTFELNRPNQLLLVAPADWHTMDKFSEDAVLLVLASEKYDPDDYIFLNPGEQA